jgi:methionyl-tRNA synthetase
MRSRAGTACSATTRAFLTGTDEHSVNIAISAEQQGKSRARSSSTRWSSCSRRPRTRCCHQLRPLHPHDRSRPRARLDEMVRRAMAAATSTRGDYEGWYCPANEFKTDASWSTGRTLPQPPDARARSG